MSSDDCGRLRVACVGDSLTRGDGLHEHPPAHRVPSSKMRRRNPKQFSIRQRGNYPALLARLLPRADVRNFGHGGATACQGGNPPYGQVREYPAALRFKPHVIVLMLGTNDAKGPLWRGSCSDPSRSLSRGLSAIVDAFFESESPPQLLLLLQPPPILRRRIFGIERALLPDVRQVIAKVAIEQQQQHAGRRRVALAPPLPADGLDETFFTADRLHLNANGSAVLACAAHDALHQVAAAAAPTLRRAIAGASRLPAADADDRRVQAAKELAVTRAECARPPARSCWDPFCAADRPAPDDGHLRHCEADSGALAPFLLTGMPCTGGPAAAGAACYAIRRRFGMRALDKVAVPATRRMALPPPPPLATLGTGGAEWRPSTRDERRAALLASGADRQVLGGRSAAPASVWCSPWVRSTDDGLACSASVWAGGAGVAALGGLVCAGVCCALHACTWRGRQRSHSYARL